MRSLKYTVVALTPLLGAGGFAQGLNLGMTDGLILQAQALAQAGSDGKPKAKTRRRARPLLAPASKRTQRKRGTRRRFQRGVR